MRSTSYARAAATVLALALGVMPLVAGPAAAKPSDAVRRRAFNLFALPIEILQVMVRVLYLQGPFFEDVAHLEFEVLGYAVVVLFLATWGISAGYGRSAAWKNVTALWRPCIVIRIGTTMVSTTRIGIYTRSRSLVSDAKTKAL